MKQAITVRIAPELLAAARECAKAENRTLTNFLETALKERVTAAVSTGNVQQPSAASRKNVKRTTDARG
jgi:hypothetical protein